MSHRLRLAGGTSSGFAALALLLPVLSGCFELKQPDPQVDGVRIDADENGWIFYSSFGIDGAWYTYGDRYGDGNCQRGGHPVEACSTIFRPDPETPGFPNDGMGVLCTMGETAVVPSCVAESCGDESTELDFQNVWGAGIGLDWISPKAGQGGQPERKTPWNPLAHGVIGVAFEFDSVDGAPLRLEFPVQLPPGSEPPTTETHLRGSPYWGADGTFNASPVRDGYNRVLWSEVAAPVDDYDFDATQLLAMQFHVLSTSGNGAKREPYAFCIANLTLLRE